MATVAAGLGDILMIAKCVTLHRYMLYVETLMSVRCMMPKARSYGSGVMDGWTERHEVLVPVNLHQHRGTVTVSVSLHDVAADRCNQEINVHPPYNADWYISATRLITDSDAGRVHSWCSGLHPRCESG